MLQCKEDIYLEKVGHRRGMDHNGKIGECSNQFTMFPLIPFSGEEAPN
jgi:hypothetical protein